MGPRPFLLAPGASGGIERLDPYISGLARRGFTAIALDLPRSRTEPALATYREALAALTAERTVIGGHSFGGRVASLLAADTPVAALVVFAYPLHPPGKAQLWDERTSHWPRISCPTLLLSGESDPFAQMDLLRDAVRRLPNAELVTFPRVRHGVTPVLDAALDRVAAFLARL